MIKILNGIKETVEFDKDTSFLLMDNTDFEEYPPHWHTPLEIVMPLEGIYTVDCNGTTYELKERDILIIAPGALHHMHASKGHRLIFQANLGKSDVFRSFDPFFNYIQTAIAITPEEHPDVHESAANYMMNIYKEYSDDSNPYMDASIYANLINLLLVCAKECTISKSSFATVSNNKQQEYMEKFVAICKYVNEHCTEDLSLEDISERAGFSKYHFSRLFKDFTNTSFHKYLNIQRISYAESLLLDPNLSITEVAIASGFNSISAFMRMFKLIKGCTPTEFRKMHQICDFDGFRKPINKP